MKSCHKKATVQCSQKGRTRRSIGFVNGAKRSIMIPIRRMKKGSAKNQYPSVTQATRRSYHKPLERSFCRSRAGRQYSSKKVTPKNTTKGHEPRYALIYCWNAASAVLRCNERGV